MEQEIGFWSEKPQQNQITSKKFTRGQNLKISSRTGSIWKLFGNRFKVCFFHTIFIILKNHLHGKYTIILRCLKSATQPQIPYTLVCEKRIQIYKIRIHSQVFWLDGRLPTKILVGVCVFYIAVYVFYILYAYTTVSVAVQHFKHPKMGSGASYIL